MRKKRYSKDGIEASSATYRKATNAIAEYLDIEVEHTLSPKADFESMVGNLDEEVAEIALYFYRLGLRRGLIKATDWVVDGKFKYKNGVLEGPNNFSLPMTIRMPNGRKKSRTFAFKAKDLGFE